MAKDERPTRQIDIAIITRERRADVVRAIESVRKDMADGDRLRVLENGEFERLGSTETIRVDVRIIAATNRNLDAAVADGSFREDLFYRIGVFPISLPPLRERRDDVPLPAEGLMPGDPAWESTWDADA